MCVKIVFIGAERDSLKRLSIGGYEGGNGYIYCIVDTLNIPAESIILNMISSIIFEKNTLHAVLLRYRRREKVAR